MIEFIVTTHADYVDEITEQLENFGALAITLQDATNEPIYEPKPGEVIRWQVMNLTALFDANASPENIRAYLNSLLENNVLQCMSVHEIEDKDWVHASQDQSKPTLFGKKLWVSPTWAAREENDAITVLFDPGLAFGTGEHPTTALCLDWLDENIKGGEVVVDYGCGSGILAIAAIKLGAKSAIAIDYDPQALYATKMNAELNDISLDRLQCRAPDIAELPQADLVVANIISATLIDLAGAFKRILKPNGKLVLSGILHSQLEALILAYSTFFTPYHIANRGEWVRVELRAISE